MEPPHSIDQSLRFLTFTPDRPNDDESRRIVRSHAIRDAIRKRQLEAAPGQKKPSPKTPPVPKSQAEHTGRFRLGKPKTKPRTKAQAASRRKEPNSRTADNVDYEDHEGCSGQCLQGLERHRHSLVPGPGDGRLDPFDTLPIKIGSRQKLLIQYQDAAFKQNNFVYNPCETSISYAAADPAWLNATLSLVSLHFDLSTGRKVSQESLFHRGEALRIVNERLRTSFEVFSDGTIGAVASLANFDTMNGSFTGATTHHKGLMQMVSKRGGLLGLNGKSILQKNVGWSDLCYSLSWDRIPQFPVIQTHDCKGTVDQYLDHFGTLYSTDLSSSADLFGEISLVLQSMRVLSIILAKEDISNMDREIFTRGVYIAEYSLLTILDEVTYSKDAPTLCCTHRNSHVYGSCRLAAYLYLYLALRELPKSAKIVQTLVKRLKSTLETVTGDLLFVWKDDLYLLLWILSMGGTAASGPIERQYFVKLLARVARVMNLETLEMFKDALRVVLWLEDFCAPLSARLWEEMGLASVLPL